MYAFADPIVRAEIVAAGDTAVEDVDVGDDVDLRIGQEGLFDAAVHQTGLWAKDGVGWVVYEQRVDLS